MQTIPQEIQELEEKLTIAEGVEKAPILMDLLTCYGNIREYERYLELTNQFMQIAEAHQDDYLKMEAWMYHAKYYYAQQKFEEVQKFFAQIEKLNKKVNHLEMWGKWHLLNADMALRQQRYETAKEHLESLIVINYGGNILIEIKVEQLFGFAAQFTGKYEQAIDYFFKALRLAEKTTSEKRAISKLTAILYLNIANLYTYKGISLKEGVLEQSDVIDLLEKALKIATAFQYKFILYEIHLQLGQIKMKNKEFEEALKHNYLALELAESFQNQNLILYCKIYLASIYYSKGEIETTIEYCQSTLKLASKLNYKPEISSSHLKLSECFLKQKKYNLSLEHAEKGLIVASEIKRMNNVLSFYELLASIHKQLGNVEEVFDYLQKYITLKDEMYTAEKEKSITEMQTKYDTEKKEQEAQQLRELEQLKSRFFSQITHEFRTPLTLILGPVQQLLQHQKVKADTELQNRLTLVQRNGQRLSNLVNQLLDLSKLESGKMTIQKKHGDVDCLHKRHIRQF